MSINDYLIEQKDIDWPSLMQLFKWLLPKRFTLWLVTKFADLILVFEDGSVHLFRADSGQLEKLADSRDSFYELIDINENALSTDTWCRC